MLLKQSTARSRAILMVDSSDHVTGKTGLTLTITASKDGGAFASITPTVTELATGWYKLALTTAHTDTLGDLALHITSTGADPTDIADQVLLDLPGPSGAATTTALADAILGRDLASVTESAMPKKSLYAAIAKAVNKVAIAAGTLSIYRTDDTTVHATQTMATDAAAVPIVSQTKAA